MKNRLFLRRLQKVYCRCGNAKDERKIRKKHERNLYDKYSVEWCCRRSLLFCCLLIYLLFIENNEEKKLCTSKERERAKKSKTKLSSFNLKFGSCQRFASSSSSPPLCVPCTLSSESGMPTAAYTIQYKLYFNRISYFYDVFDDIYGFKNALRRSLNTHTIYFTAFVWTLFLISAEIGSVCIVYMCISHK